jgi:catechol 2,3-dioxygenase-like lactoylglutathione lyase family enzyme
MRRTPSSWCRAAATRRASTRGPRSVPAAAYYATFEKVRESGAEIVQEPTEQPWGTRDFAVRDPAGNLVRIDQPPAA